jgi:hypothetical protein
MWNDAALRLFSKYSKVRPATPEIGVLPVYLEKILYGQVYDT